MALPLSPDPTDRRAAVVRLLAASPEGLSDAALARALGGPEAGIRPQAVSQLCRRMAADGALERVGTRPILNRLPASRPVRSRGSSPTTRAVVGTATSPLEAADTASAPATSPERRRNGTSSSSDTARTPRGGKRPTPQTATPAATAPDTSGFAPRDSPDHAPESEASTTAGSAPTPTSGAPPYDALQAWSRVVNVQALVARWLIRRGATLRSATLDGHGPARELVASLDGDDVHVEVTGWPPDEARTHPTTIAGDWFVAAEQAALERRRAHPRARIVIALPDTRRYRSLTARHAASLDGARAEVWFVDRAGGVHAR